MKELIFNDARSLEIQSAKEEGGSLKLRFILTTAEQLKAHFLDAFATQRMRMVENHKEVQTFEHYHKPSFKEEYGGIWEVELVQKEKDTGTLMKEFTEGLDVAKQELEDTKAELTITKRESLETKETLTWTEHELSETKEELAQTKETLEQTQNALSAAEEQITDLQVAMCELYEGMEA